MLPVSWHLADPPSRSQLMGQMGQMTGQDQVQMLQSLQNMAGRKVKEVSIPGIESYLVCHEDFVQPYFVPLLAQSSFLRAPD